MHRPYESEAHGSGGTALPAGDFRGRHLLQGSTLIAFLEKQCRGVGGGACMELSPGFIWLRYGLVLPGPFISEFGV